MGVQTTSLEHIGVEDIKPPNWHTIQPPTTCEWHLCVSMQVSRDV